MLETDASDGRAGVLVVSSPLAAGPAGGPHKSTVVNTSVERQDIEKTLATDMQRVAECHMASVSQLIGWAMLPQAYVHVTCAELATAQTVLLINFLLTLLLPCMHSYQISLGSLIFGTETA